MRKGEVKLNFRVSVWPLIAIYQQREQQAPGPINTSWCSGSTAEEKSPVSAASLTIHGGKQTEPPMTRATCAQLVNYRGRGRTNASFCDIQLQGSRGNTLKVEWFHLIVCFYGKLLYIFFYYSYNTDVFVGAAINAPHSSPVTSLPTTHTPSFPNTL